MFNKLYARGTGILKEERVKSHTYFHSQGRRKTGELSLQSGWSQHICPSEFLGGSRLRLTATVGRGLLGLNVGEL